MTSGLATVYRHPRAARGKKAECRPKDADVFVHFLHTTGKRTLPIIMNVGYLIISGNGPYLG